ncbi:MAG: LPS export ABC transporter periplasmic protein LptC [Robiginitomaculum sp.]|nr:MAG: LPS export ABC transporter periplasmic protein LptC [Robiginitomaculum sp.]
MYLSYKAGILAIVSNMTSASADIAARPALAYWEPRRVLTLEAARRHSSIIRIARFVLIGFAGFLMLLLLWFFVKTPQSIVSEDNPDETVKMIRPVYKGRTSDNLPYRITADVAVRFIQSPDETKLVNPVLNFLRTNGAEESIVLAANGLYNAETQVLELHNDVNLQTDDGTDCKTTHARIFVKVKRIEGDELIDCTGGFGRAGGNAYEINENYTVLVFKQGMTAHIIPKKTPELRGAQE